MIQRVADADEAKLHLSWIDRVERDRLEEMVDLLDRLRLRGVLDRLPGKTAPDRIDGNSRDLQRGAPGDLERDRPARLGHEGLETADGRVGACSGDPLDETRKLIEPWIKRGDTRQFEDAAERRERQDAIGIVESRAHPVG